MSSTTAEPVNLTSMELEAIAKITDAFDGDLIEGGLELLVDVANQDGRIVGSIKVKGDDGYFFYPASSPS